MSGLDDMIGGFGSALSAAGLVAGVLTAVTATMLDLAAAAEESALAMAKVESSIKSTEGAAGKSVEDIDKMSNKLAKLSGIDDDVIMSASGMLLTFKAVKGEMFDQTMLAALDMQAKGFGNLEGNVVQLGKALSSFEGYSALKRAGVDFTDEQLKQIKNFKETNNLAGYQALIMAELKTQVDGTAAAMNGASDGSANLNLEWENLKENLGTLVLPLLREFNAGLTGMIGFLNESWSTISVVIQFLGELGRAWQAVMSLGISEGLRAIWGAAANNYATTPDTMPHATGGSFLIPQSYGNEGFRLGNGDTASGGERITITPANQSTPGGPTVNINTLTIGNTSGISKDEIKKMMVKALVEVTR